MERIEIGNAILFKQKVLGGLEEFELFGVSNESGSWVSLNDIVELLDFGSNKKKRMKKYTNENDICKINVKRKESNTDTEEYFIRDSVVCDIIFKFREERKLVEQFIFDVIGQLNGGLTYSVTDVKYAKEIKEYKEWLNNADNENNMFIAHKENSEIHTYIGPSIDEALYILYKASLE